MHTLHLLALLSVSATYAEQVPVPAISFEKTHHDFGKMNENQKASYKYKVTNSGSAPLRIKRIIPSCGCSFTVVGQMSLKPGDTTFIEVHFDSKGMTGNIHKVLEIHSNDPNKPKITLTFEASVMRDIMPSTTAVHFNKVPRSGEVTSSIRLESGNGQPVIVKSTKIPGAPFVTCTQRKDGIDVVLDIKLNAVLVPKQKYDGIETLTVQTSSKSKPLLQFYIYWDLVTAVAVTPEKLKWSGEAGKELVDSIQLNSLSGKSFKILGAKTSSPFIKVSGISNKSATTHTLSVTLSSKTKVGGLKEKITLLLDDPNQTEMEIEVSGMLW